MARAPAPWTPGPRFDGGTVHDADGGLVCLIPSGNRARQNEVMALIAEAPELQSLLEEIRALLFWDGATAAERNLRISAWMDKSKAALARVKQGAR